MENVEKVKKVFVYRHEAKICERKRGNGARVFYIEYCEEKHRKYTRAHEGLCRCKSSTERRPCEHLLLAQQVILDYKVSGLPSAKIDLSLPALFEKYEAEHSDGRISPKTLTLYSYGWTYLLEYTKTTPVNRASELTPKLMMSYKWWLRGPKEESDVYTNILLRGLRTIFNWAIRERYLESNPLSGANLQSNQKIISKTPVNLRERNPLTDDEARRIEAKAQGYIKDMSLVFLHSGMRLGELINLPFAHVTETCVRIDEIEDWHPKQHQKRDVPMHPVVKEIIERRRRDFPSARFVFETSNGTRYLDSNLQKRFKSLFKRLAIVGEDRVGVTIHCFRHTFATKLLNANVPATIVKDLLGHKDLRTTMLYHHRIQARSADMISMLHY